MILVNRYSYIANPPNGNPNFYAAMRLMSPTANGQVFTATAGDTVTYSCVFHLQASWDATNQDLVCFVQDNDLREVLQSRMEPITPQPAQDVDVALAPVNPPLQIPAQGGSFNFNISLTNSLDSTAHFHTWIVQQNPAGLWEGPLLGPIWLAEPASLTITRMRSQNVPGSAAPGVYTYRAFVGMYNEDSHWDSSSFTYTKLTSGNGPLVSGWENSGESFDPMEQTGLTTAIPSQYVTIAANPNPFNPTTAISYELSASSHVSLKVFDITGQLVATLVDGWREGGNHEVTFDGSNLASGVYLYALTAGQTHASGKIVLLK
jgi:hypothetical protein